MVGAGAADAAGVASLAVGAGTVMLVEAAGTALVDDVAGERALIVALGVGVVIVGAGAGTAAALFSRRPMRNPPTAKVPMMTAMAANVTQRRRSARTAS